MQSFTSGKKHSFEIDGKPYFINTIVFGDAEEIAQIAKSDDGVQATLNYMRSKMDKRTADAVDKLAISDVMELLGAWTGGLMGKSGSSAESSQSTDQSSQPTSEENSESPSGE